MVRETRFGEIYSYQDLNLIQQKVDIQPAEPKLNLVDIPGGDGSKDMSEQPAGRVVYKARKITWTFALYPGENWHNKHHQVSNALNGKQCRITLHDDPDCYFEGRLAVKKYNRDKALRQITVEATCDPWIKKQVDTRKEASLTTEFQTITLKNWRKPVIPEITVSSETAIRWSGATVTLPAGSHRLLGIELQEGENLLEARVPSGTGTIVITYREGSL